MRVRLMSQYNTRKREIRAGELIKSKAYPGPKSAQRDDFTGYEYGETEAERNARGPAFLCVGFAAFLCLFGLVIAPLYLINA